MGRVVLQYSHCTSDTARRLGEWSTQGAGRSAGARALGVGRHGRAGTGTLGAQTRSTAGARGAATWQLGLRHDRGA